MAQHADAMDGSRRDVAAQLDALLELVRKSWRSTSRRDFVVVPLVVLLDQPFRQRRLRPLGLVLMAIGYLMYLLGGSYRTRIGGGGPGVSGPPPEQLVTSGIYAFTRNPMYSGHVVYLFGLALLTSSPAALAFALGNLPWFNARVRDDEERLRAIFGEEYDRYMAAVPRWGFNPQRLKGLLAPTS